jgi:hypothetical protein
MTELLASLADRRRIDQRHVGRRVRHQDCIEQPRYDSAFQTLSENGYKWREYDAEDTIRFYALRCRDTGFIKSSPQKIIAEGTDWRFLDELKRELKA